MLRERISERLCHQLDGKGGNSEQGFHSSEGSKKDTSLPESLYMNIWRDWEMSRMS